MKRRFVFCLILSGLVGLTSVADVPTRILNNGNLILENIPEIDPEIVEGLQRYQNVRSAPFRDWTADGEGMYIMTRFGDMVQIHRVVQPGGAREQLTFFEEPVASVARNPKSDQLLFLMDSGGDENDQIFVMDPVTRDIRMLSDGISRHQSAQWSPCGRRVVYQSNKRDGASNDVWILDIEDPASASMVWEAPDRTWWGAGAWSKDGRLLLVQQYESASSSRIFLLDLDSGESRLLEGSVETKETNLGLDFMPDGSGYFFITNRFSEHGQLAFRDLESGGLTNLTESIPWGLESFAISEDGRRAAFSMNEDGISRLYLLDTTDFSYAAVEGLPVGLIGGITFHPDGQQLALTLNTAQTPSDSYVLELEAEALAHGGLTRWTFSEVGGLDTTQFALPSLVRFESFDGLEVPAFVYRPKGEGPHPVIIQIHGGPESQSRPGFSSTYQQWIDQLGAAVVVPNVRGSTGYGVAYQELDNGYLREDSVKDIGALLDWIATQPDLDSERVAVFGGSYGGYMVLASAVHFSERLKAAVDVVGISNFVTFLENTQSYRRDLRRVEYGDERDPEMRSFLESISPNNHVDKIRVPLFVVQGQNDPRVPVTEAEQIVASMRDAGKTVWYMNALNEGHGYRRKENRDIYQQAVMMFFRQHL